MKVDEEGQKSSLFIAKLHNPEYFLVHILAKSPLHCTIATLFSQKHTSLTGN